MPATTEPTPSPADNTQHWTAGPAKWAAVAVLGAASIGGMAWSIWGRSPHPRLMQASTVAPAPVAIAPAPSSPTPAPKVAAPATTVSRTININTANQAELELLPGIGPSLAQRIIDDRGAHGAFRSVDDLDRVKGIGPKTIQKLRPLVRVE